MSTLFSAPKIPKFAPPTPPTPPKNTQLDAQLAQMGRRQGLMAALFGSKTPAGGSTSKTLTGQ